MADGYDLGKAYIQIIPSAKGIKGNLENVIAPEADQAGKKSGIGFTNAFNSIVKGGTKTVGKSLLELGKISFKGVVGGASALTTGLTALGGASIKAYADTEQLVGGVETLFGPDSMNLPDYAKSLGKTMDEVKGEWIKLDEASRTVQTNAMQAYKTTGLSANEYMTNVTSFAASLISSLDGDTVAAANLADRAMTDMSDNANKMGSNIQDIQNAYQGFAKQNYTMLDNLKLGYGGTKSEMERLLKDAQAISGVEYNIDSYSDVVKAIGVIQDKMKITGTTAREATETISGSFGMLKSSFSNLLSDMSNGHFEFIDANLEEIGLSIDAVLKNIKPAIKEFVAKLPDLATGIIKILQRLLPQILEFVGNIFTEVMRTIVALMPEIMSVVTNVLTLLANTIIQNLPMILEAGMQIMMALLQGIVEFIPKLVEALPTIINTIVDFFINNIGTILDASIQLMMALIDAIPVLIDALIPRLPEIIIAILNAIIEATPKLFEAGVKLFFTLIKALGQILVELGTNLPKIWESIKGALWDLPGKLWNILKEAVSNFSKWISETLSVVGPGAQKVLSSIGQWFSQLPGKIWNWIVGAIGKVGDWGSKLASKGAAAAKTLLDAVKNGVASIPGTMFNVGINLIKGFWNGIVNVKNWLWGKISGFFGGILDNIKGFFGIHSPSKVFENEIGKMLPTGMAIGIENNLKPVSKAMDQLESEAMRDITSDINFNSALNSQSSNFKKLDHLDKFSQTDNVINQRQPLQLVVEAGNHAWEVFVENIFETQDQKARLALIN